MYFGFRGCKERRDMYWGDEKLKETADGEEYLEFNERQIEQVPVQTAAMSRQFRLKCLSPMDQKKDPVVVYKLYTQKRPDKINEDDSPFYLAVNNNLKADRVALKERVAQGWSCMLA